MDKKVRKKKVPLLHICYFKIDDRPIKKEKEKLNTGQRKHDVREVQGELFILGWIECLP